MTMNQHLTRELNDEAAQMAYEEYLERREMAADLLGVDPADLVEGTVWIDGEAVTTWAVG